MTTTGLLAALEHYYDTAPRARCDTEELGPLTLFVARSGFPYYARPRLGLAEEVTTAMSKPSSNGSASSTSLARWSGSTTRRRRSSPQPVRPG